MENEVSDVSASSRFLVDDSFIPKGGSVRNDFVLSASSWAKGVWLPQNRICLFKVCEELILIFHDQLRFILVRLVARPKLSMSVPWKIHGFVVEKAAHVEIGHGLAPVKLKINSRVLEHPTQPRNLISRGPFKRLKDRLCVEVVIAPYNARGKDRPYHTRPNSNPKSSSRTSVHSECSDGKTNDPENEDTDEPRKRIEWELRFEEISPLPLSVAPRNECPVEKMVVSHYTEDDNVPHFEVPRPQNLCFHVDLSLHVKSGFLLLLLRNWAQYPFFHLCVFENKPNLEDNVLEKSKGSAHHEK